MKRIVVIGGGIAGLAAAHHFTELKKEKLLDFELVLLEASGRLGGSIATERIGDFLVEAGPDSFITEKPWALRLCERLGLTSRLVSTQSAYQKIYIVHDGKLVELPEGFFLLAPTRFWPFIQTPLFSWGGWSFTERFRETIRCTCRQNLQTHTRWNVTILSVSRGTS